MQITYCSTYWDILRCSLYSLSHRRDFLLRLTFPVLAGGFTTAHHLPLHGWITYPAGLAVWLLGMVVLSGFIVNLFIGFRLLIPHAQRVCTTTLTPTGFTDVTRRKTVSFSWSAFSEIHYHHGDIFFWRKGKDGMFVPRSAFANLSEAQEFYQQNVALWNASKYAQADFPQHDETVWPPAPRS